MIDNIKSQMRKGILEYCILLCLEQKEAYTSEILEYLKQADLLVVEGTLYPLLSRMRNNGLLSYRWQESTEGPPRKYYYITSQGEIMLGELEKEWQAICNSVNTIKNK
ncbi:MAG: PadR family transcriptional regulator [Paludibacteraceae bacterium]|nr:PadR family transcriptional regulator [Paludibacteraceae bacterium]